VPYLEDLTTQKLEIGGITLCQIRYAMSRIEILTHVLTWSQVASRVTTLIGQLVVSCSRYTVLSLGYLEGKIKFRDFVHLFLGHILSFS